MSRRARAASIADMMVPVRCRCGRIYDLTSVEVTGRWLDCTAWTAPCCGRRADDRGETGLLARHQSHYERLSADEVRWLARDRFQIDVYGRMMPVEWV